MKKIYLLLSAVALILAGSCQHIEEVFVQGKPASGEKMTIEATIAEATISEAGTAEAPETKSALQSNGKDIYWTPGDAINLFYGSSTKSKSTANITELESPAGSSPARCQATKATVSSCQPQDDTVIRLSPILGSGASTGLRRYLSLHQKLLPACFSVSRTAITTYDIKAGPSAPSQNNLPTQKRI